MRMQNVVLSSGPEATALMADATFIAQWKCLFERCSHATAFQSPRFVLAWYGAYKERWQPVVVYATDEDGHLSGLWLLARDLQCDTLVHAGAQQAEYHAWLALPGRDEAFLDAAWVLLKRHVTFSTLRLKYLPAAHLSETLKRVSGMRHCVSIRQHARPLLRLTSDAIRASFAKKSNKSRFSRLRKTGNLEFRRIVDPDELKSVLDELVAYYDFRQGAANQSTPFFDDRCKRDFHYDVFLRAPSDLYITVSYLNNKPIAAFWGESSGAAVHLGLLVYSPFVAEHSPGKLHLMQLSEYLLGEGKAVLDLTPGGDPWKERFANAHDVVDEVVIFRSSTLWISQRTFDAAASWAKRVAHFVRVPPDKARSIMRLAKRIKLSSIRNKMVNWLHSTREFRVYRCSRASIVPPGRHQHVHRNAVRDLLQFMPGEPWQSRNTFLSRALMRLEQGETVFTITHGDRLAHSGWMVKQTESYMTEVKQTMRLLPGSVAFYDFYTDPEFRGRGLYRSAVEHMLTEAFADDSIQHVYISVLADNLPSRHVIESVGFEYLTSYFWSCHLGTERTWEKGKPVEPEVACA